MRNLCLTIAYDGTEFHGWQRQGSLRTVQNVLEQTAKEVLGHTIQIRGSGRTDAGVHALGQVATFRTAATYDTPTICRALNARLPFDVVVKGVYECPDTFDANISASKKRYRYLLSDFPERNPFLDRYTYHCKCRLDVDRMHQASQHLRGRHDFHSFETNWPNRLSSIRTVFHIAVERIPVPSLWQGSLFSDDAFVLQEVVHHLDDDPEEIGKTRTNTAYRGESDNASLICLEVEADGFLYKMVRAIVGTLIQVGRGFWPEEKVAEILAAQDRAAAGPNVSPKGLFLVHVSYEP